MLETYNDVKTLHTLTSTVHRIRVGIIGNTLLLLPASYAHPHLIFLNFSCYVSFSIFFRFFKMCGDPIQRKRVSKWRLLSDSRNDTNIESENITIKRERR